MPALEAKKNIYWVGVLDKELRNFDIIMHTDYGTTYNSYLVRGSEKTVLFDTVKEPFLKSISNIFVKYAIPLKLIIL